MHASISARFRFDRARLAHSADALAVAVAVSLPWSTSATGVLIVIWLLTLLPTLDLAAVRREITTPAGGLPVLLAALGAVGMLWTDVPWATALRGFAPFSKLLIIPLLMIEFRRSDRGLWVLAGFLISCTALLTVSVTIAVWPGFAWRGVKDYGVPVKDYIAQAGEFVICAVATAYAALNLHRAGRRFVAIALSLLSAAFLLNIFFLATSRTALVTIPVLVVLFGLRQFSWKGVIGVAMAATVLAAVVWASSPYLRERVTRLAYEIEAYQANRALTSTGERLGYWKRSLVIISESPVIGHGTGSIRSMFEKALADETGVGALPTRNPHNQTLAVGLQLGLAGIAVLFAMWFSHLLLFRQPGLISWIGLVVVTQNIVSSLFNSHLFDFTQGWIYVFGVGVAGGMVLRREQGHEIAGALTDWPARSSAQAQRPV